MKASYMLHMHLKVEVLYISTFTCVHTIKFTVNTLVCENSHFCLKVGCLDTKGKDSSKVLCFSQLFTIFHYFLKSHSCTNLIQSLPKTGDAFCVNVQ